MIEKHELRCTHCGMRGHVRVDCKWARESDLELERERLRRANKKSNLEPIHPSDASPS